MTPAAIEIIGALAGVAARLSEFRMRNLIAVGADRTLRSMANA